MSEICATCGAMLPEGSTCQSIFDEFLNLEFADPAYGQVHYLTVTSFMVQHERYSNEALAWTQAALKKYLNENLSGSQMRQHAAQTANLATRTWRVTRRADAPPLPKVAWTMTIADVERGIHDAETYCEQIKLWARTILHQMEAYTKQTNA